jgi:Flp pilus assembly protein TadB
VTSVDPDPPAEFVSRERTYVAMMAVRMIAIVLAVLVSGPWRWIAIALGVLLPYVAVVLVNQARLRNSSVSPPAPAAHRPELRGHL